MQLLCLRSLAQQSEGSGQSLGLNVYIICKPFLSNLCVSLSIYKIEYLIETVFIIKVSRHSVRQSSYTSAAEFEASRHCFYV